jgi:hypothetical protein
MLALAGCKKQESLEESIRKTWAKAGRRVDAIGCPEDQGKKKGDVFECKISVEGDFYMVEVTREDDKLRYRAKGVLFPSELANDLQGQIKEKLPDVRIDCGSPGLRHFKAGDHFFCTASAKDHPDDRVPILMVDDYGTWKVDRTAASAGAN